jgi:hypothetical protein
LAVADLHHDRIDEDRRVTSSSGRTAQSCISVSTASVIRLIVSVDTDAP